MDINNIDTTTLKTIASMIDDSSIAIRKMGKDGRQYVLNITLKKRDRGLIDYLHGLFGGGVYKEKMRKGGDSYRFLWKIYANKAQSVLLLVLPYLVKNKRQAELGLDFQDITSHQKKGQKLSDKDIEIRQEYMETIKSLNMLKSRSVSQYSK